jgi:A/G-specific adenine glycosylase
MDADRLIAWYERVKRDLPWRHTRDPYAILVSEVMLQQTQAARVVPYYERWLAAWPTAEALAEAEPAEVLRQWSGLGYNRRALALQRAAQEVAAGGWPEDLTELPGVGPYTAAAVASFAFGAEIAAVDVNHQRVTRRHGSSPPPGPQTNQAMMELGATVCTARSPRCEECPVENTCARHPDPPPRPGKRERFEDTDRYLRGRTVAALLDGAPPPPGAERVLAGLEQDGLVVRGKDGRPALPRR